MRRGWWVASGVVGTAWLLWFTHHRLTISLLDPNHPVPIAADGAWHPLAYVNDEASLRGISRDSVKVTARGMDADRIRLGKDSAPGVLVYARAPISAAVVRFSASGFGQRVELPVQFASTYRDTFSDGTPDWMRLHAAEDQAAFRRWFTTLAEELADTPDARLPPEIIDCASVLRYSYREALLKHDDKWFVSQTPEHAQLVASLPQIKQWNYPQTPLGAALWRVKPGPFVHGDETNGSFAQFADAKTLMSDNTFRVSRSLTVAQPGDLLFYRVLGEDSQYHSMIVTGERAQWVVYHTGPIHHHRGEMRRVLLADLLRHPDPKWRPEERNPNFLGVFRWDILRER